MAKRAWPNRCDARASCTRGVDAVHIAPGSGASLSGRIAASQGEPALAARRYRACPRPLAKKCGKILTIKVLGSTVSPRTALFASLPLGNGRTSFMPCRFQHALRIWGAHGLPHFVRPCIAMHEDRARRRPAGAGGAGIERLPAAPDRDVLDPGAGQRWPAVRRRDFHRQGRSASPQARTTTRSCSAPTARPGRRRSAK